MIRHGLFILLLISQASLAAADSLHQSDGDFLDSNWVVETLLAGSASVDAVVTLPTGGDPGAYRDMSMSLGVAPTDGVAAAQLFSSAVWDPSEDGSILGINFSLDFAALDGNPTRVGLVIEQGGMLYSHVLVNGDDDPDWHSFSVFWLEAEDFPPLDIFESGQPDFSENGGPLRFGFATGQFAIYAGGTTSLHHGVDNWSVAVNPSPRTLELSDADFSTADWDTLGFVAGNASVDAVSTQADGGNPGAYREAIMSLGTAPLDGIALTQIYNPAVYDPAVDGPIDALHFTVDFTALDGVPTRLGIAIEQDGVIYAHVVADQADHVDWVAYDGLWLEAADFPPLDIFESGQPNFTTTGAPMRFGFATGQFALFAGGTENLRHGIDNWSVTVNPAAPIIDLGDGDFLAGDWDTLGFVAGTGNIDALSTPSAGGNPGAYREMQMSLGTAPSDGVALAQIYTPFTWNPVQDGPISQLSYSLDCAVFDGTPTRLGLIVEQEGMIYAHIIDPLAAAGYWTSYSDNKLHAADFPPLNPFDSGLPDFTTAGAPLRFGFATGQFAIFADGAATLHHGLDNWRVLINDEITVTGVSTPPAAAPVLRLAANFPNPFNPFTTLEFELNRAAPVTLRVLDLQGRFVRTLIDDKPLPAGRHHVDWNGKDERGRELASGVYFCRMSDGTAVITRKMTLLR